MSMNEMLLQTGKFVENTDVDVFASRTDGWCHGRHEKINRDVGQSQCKTVLPLFVSGTRFLQWRIPADAPHIQRGAPSDEKSGQSGSFCPD